MINILILLAVLPDLSLLQDDCFLCRPIQQLSTEPVEQELDETQPIKKQILTVKPIIQSAIEPKSKPPMSCKRKGLVVDITKEGTITTIIHTRNVCVPWPDTGEYGSTIEYIYLKNLDLDSPVHFDEDYYKDLNKSYDYGEIIDMKK